MDRSFGASPAGIVLLTALALRPTRGVENEFTGSWLVYAILFGVASLPVFFI